MAMKNRTTGNRSTGIAQKREELMSAIDLLPTVRGAAPTRTSVEHAPADKLIEDIKNAEERKILEGTQAHQSAKDPQEDTAKNHSPALSSSENGCFEVDIKSLKSHPWNARVFRSKVRVSEVALSLAANGQDNPVIVTEDPKESGTFYIIDGETRYQAALSLKLKTLWVRLKEIDPENPLEVYSKSLQHTNATEPISLVDQAIRWQSLIDLKLADFDTIVKETGKNKGTVSKMMAYNKFPSAVQEFMAHHPENFPYSIASELANIIGEDISEEDILIICNEIVTHNISRRGLEALVKQKFHTHNHRRSYNKRKQPQVNIPIKKGETAIGGLRTFDSGEIEFKIQSEADIDENSRVVVNTVLEALAETAGKNNSEEMKLLILSKLNEIKQN